MALPGMADDRFQTMSLQSAGACTIANKERPACAHESNYVGDIDGAAPELKYMRYTARRPDLYVTKDIEKSSPMKLHARGPQPNPNEWHNNPIEGSKPRETRFKSNRHTDPLAPEYVLPRCKLEKPPTPKFIRDGYTVTDIDGTVPKPLYPLAMRDTYNVHDIEGAQASWRPRHERARREAPPRDGLDVRDIMDEGFTTTRVTDPMNPHYFMNGMETCDDPIRTKPRALPKAIPGPYRSLYTDDILGAKSGWRPPHEMQPPPEKRRHWRHTNFVGDIGGAQADTVQHTIPTKRRTNPLNPAYRSLDGDILPDPTKPDFSHIYDHFLGPSQGSAPPSLRGGSAPRQAPAPAVNRLVLKSSDGRPRATPRSGRSGPGSARSTGRRVLATPHDRREAQQDAADRAAVAALH